MNASDHRAFEYRGDYKRSPAIEWEDPDENNGEWPYPTRYVRRVLTGPLADAVRRRLGVDESTPVQITEAKISGGYSEYTQETDYEMTISCGDTGRTFESYDGENNLVLLLAWLDEVSP